MRVAANNSEAAYLHKKALQGTGTNKCTCLLQGAKKINAVTGGGWIGSEPARQRLARTIKIGLARIIPSQSTRTQFTSNPR